MTQANALREERERQAAEEAAAAERAKLNRASSSFKDEEDLIAAPVLSKEDWQKGESRKEAHAKRTARKDGLLGGINAGREWCARWSRRILISLALFLVA